MSELPDNVVQLEVLRINRNIDKRCTCTNRSFIVDTKNREINCKECGARVDPFEAMHELACAHERINEQHRKLLEQRKELQSYKPWLLAIRELERNYRSGKMLPCCPHCGGGVYLEELLTRFVGSEYEDLRRMRAKE